MDSSRAIQDKDTPLVVISSGQKIRKDSDWEDKVRESNDELPMAGADTRNSNAI
jgi:hypothetical protein